MWHCFGLQYFNQDLLGREVLVATKRKCKRRTRRYQTHTQLAEERRRLYGYYARLMEELRVKTHSYSSTTSGWSLPYLMILPWMRPECFICCCDTVRLLNLECCKSAVKIHFKCCSIFLHFECTSKVLRMNKTFRPVTRMWLNICQESTQNSLRIFQNALRLSKNVQKIFILMAFRHSCD